MNQQTVQGSRSEKKYGFFREYNFSKQSNYTRTQTMKSLFFFFVFCAVLTRLAAETKRFSPRPESPRCIKVGTTPVIELSASQGFEIVIPVGAVRAVRYAAKELAQKLEHITGKKISPIHVTSGRVPAFFLGTTPEATKLGLDPSKLDRDGYFIKTVGKNIFIVGRDARNSNPAKSAGYYERATLYGVYEFLERFCGVRYYFPGKIGTIVPQCKKLKIPSIDITDRPDNQIRRVYSIPVLDSSKEAFAYPGFDRRESALNWRKNTLDIPNCHGLNRLELPQRFAKNHPEYFALKTDGTRFDGLSNHMRIDDKYGQLCYASKGLQEEVYRDAVAVLTGQPASSRNISRFSLHKAPFFNLMPNDSMYWCQCPICKPIGKMSDQDKSNHIWRFITGVAKKLKDNHIPGFVTTMAYSSYKKIPDMKIPDNVIVELALRGPWYEANSGREAEDKLLADWHRKLGSKLYVWTYPTKLIAKVKLIPNFTPRAVGSFYKRQTPLIFGSFLEAETDRWIFGFMNTYIFSKVMWDSSIDVDALIDEHCRLMYGKAAPLMLEFYNTLEKHWLTNIMGSVVDTPRGFKAIIPSQYELWNNIYSKAEMDKIGKILDAAEKAVVADVMALARVRFMRTNLWNPVTTARQQYLATINEKVFWRAYMPEVSGPLVIDGQLNDSAWAQAPVVWMIPRRGDEANVHTRVRMLRDHDNYYFGIECDEPQTDKMIANILKPDEIEIWKDNVVELFFAAGPRKKSLYQFIVNSNGTITDLTTKIADTSKWNSGVEAKTSILRGKMWVVEIKIPRRAMPDLGTKEFVGNFTRTRRLNTDTIGGLNEEYVWAPFPRQIADNCGTIIPAATPKNRSIVLDGDFEEEVKGLRRIGKNWRTPGRAIGRDTQVFRTGGASLRLDRDGGRGNQYLYDRIKPDTVYRLSFFLKLENVKKNDISSGFYINLRYGFKGKDSTYRPIKNAFTGTIPWTRMEYVFRTPKAKIGTDSSPYLEFNTRKTTGKCWIDHVELVKVKQE